MKQILQDLKKGKTLLEEVPCPQNNAQSMLIETTVSLISSGTERMLMNFGKAGMVGKMRQQPDKVKMVLDKVKTDGLMTTIETVQSKLDQPLPLGYCNVGTVFEVGNEVQSFANGDRVISNGKHAEMVSVPQNLCAKIPDNVTDEQAAFTVVGAIGLQGVRLLQPTLGECIVVFGLGLIGLMTVQLLKAHGCRVLGIDFDEQKLALAKEFGAETVSLLQGQNPIVVAQKFSRNRGVDGVIITAATKDNKLMHQAATMCRKRGRIVLVGVTGLHLKRDDFYKKELSFQVSCSYGPGRYDESYEEQGQDYPVGFVRWTEQRNFEAVLDMMASKQLNVEPLITHRFMIDDAIEAYSVLEKEKNALGIVMQYPKDTQSVKSNKTVALDLTTKADGVTSISFVGAGNYASRVLIPAFKKTKANFNTIVSSTGVSSTVFGKKFKFYNATTDYDEVLNDETSNVVVIATRHNLHAKQVLQALKAGKHVFVEKPLAIYAEELEEIKQYYCNMDVENRPVLCLGFNRRFAPHITKAKELLTSINQPINIAITVNAGFIPYGSWIHDRNIGGGRMIGEGCHFIDLARFLADSKIAEYHCVAIHAERAMKRDENVSVVLRLVKWFQRNS